MSVPRAGNNRDRAARTLAALTLRRAGDMAESMAAVPTVETMRIEPRGLALTGIGDGPDPPSATALDALDACASSEDTPVP